MNVFVVQLILLALCDLTLPANEVAKNSLSENDKKEWEAKLCDILSIRASKFYEPTTKGQAVTDEMNKMYDRCAGVMRTAIDKGFGPEYVRKIVRLYGSQNSNIDKVYNLRDIEKLFTLIGNWEPKTIITFLHCTSHLKNRGELATQAATYADANWWREILNDVPLVRIIKNTLKLEKVIARTGYKAAFKYYTKVARLYTVNTNIYPTCAEPVVMSILKFSAKSEIFLSDETLHLLFEAGCDMCDKGKDHYRRCRNQNFRGWADLDMILSDDNFIKAPRFIVDAFLEFKEKEQLSTKGLIPLVISEVTKCKERDCVGNTMGTILCTIENGFDQEVLNSVLGKAEQDGRRVAYIYNFFKALYAADQNGKGTETSRKIFSNWDDKLVAFFYFFYDSCKNSKNSLVTYKKFMYNALQNGWTKESIIDFICRTQKINLFSTQYGYFWYVLNVSDSRRVFPILELFETTVGEYSFMWLEMSKQNLQVDVDKLTTLANRSSQLKHAVIYFLTNPGVKECGVETIECISNYVSFSASEGANAADYHGLFDRACGRNEIGARAKITAAVENKVSRRQLLADLLRN